ncbi:unnamed protein product [Ranitomeya imitator]|uniref:Uncharacterized protein n=1 Tax=Ranitomeya imitator TaxID=111125 RepID=A0ABN9MB62_9NEOB|nr:unnamed protein product [Ranitomeya imitator]
MYLYRITNPMQVNGKAEYFSAGPKKQIQALRTVLKKEVNKVEKSKKSVAGTDEVYVPKLWYYDLMAFTRDQEIPRPCQTVTSFCEPSAKEILPESLDEQVPLQQRETTEANNV